MASTQRVKPATGQARWRLSRSARWWILVLFLVATVPVAVPVVAVNWPAPSGQGPAWPPAQAPAAAPSASRSVPPGAGGAAPPATGQPPPVPSLTGATTRPDLVVLSVSWTPATPRDGDLVLFSARVSNAGTASVPVGLAFTVELNTVAWAHRDVRPLAPGAERVYAADGGPIGYSFWFATPGAHTVGAVVGDGGGRADGVAGAGATRSVALTVG